jgi:hypothetical protein
MADPKPGRAAQEPPWEETDLLAALDEALLERARANHWPEKESKLVIGRIKGVLPRFAEELARCRDLMDGLRSDGVTLGKGAAKPFARWTMDLVDRLDELE